MRLISILDLVVRALDIEGLSVADREPGNQHKSELRACDRREQPRGSSKG
jgi:hypothetical protein